MNEVNSAKQRIKKNRQDYDFGFANNNNNGMNRIGSDVNNANLSELIGFVGGKKREKRRKKKSLNKDRGLYSISSCFHYLTAYSLPYSSQVGWWKWLCAKYKNV